MPEIKTGFESCLAPEPTELTFLGKGDAYIGKVKLRPLTREDLTELQGKDIYEQLAKSIIEWDFKEIKNGEENLLEINPDNVKKLNLLIQLNLTKSMNELSWGLGVEEKNSETQSVSS
jgi:hypothetical protein